MDPEAPDELSREELESRVEQLEETVSKMLPDRRGVLKGLGAAAIGGAAVGGATGGASGQSAAGQVGTSSEPVDTFAFDLDVQNGATFNGSDVSGVGSLSTIAATVTPDNSAPVSYPYGVARLVADGNVVAIGGETSGGLEVFDASNNDVFQAAFDAINPSADTSVAGEIHLPANTTLTQTSSLKPKPAVDVVTHGNSGISTGVEFTATGSTAHGIHADDPNSLRYATWDGFFIEGPGRTETTGVAFKAETSQNAHFDLTSQIHIRGWGNKAVEWTNVYDCNVAGFLAFDVEPEVTTGDTFSAVVDISTGGNPGINIARIEVYPGGNVSKDTASGNAQRAVLLGADGHTSRVGTVNVGGVPREMEVRGGWKVERVNWEPDTDGGGTLAYVVSITGSGGAELRKLNINDSQNAISQNYGVRIESSPEDCGLGTVTGDVSELATNRVELLDEPAGPVYYDGVTNHITDNSGVTLTEPNTIYARDGPLSS